MDFNFHFDILHQTNSHRDECFFEVRHTLNSGERVGGSILNLSTSLSVNSFYCHFHKSERF